MGDKTVNPLLFLLSDYPSGDTGASGGYDDRMRLPLGSLDFGHPDRVKVLESVTLLYQSLREIPWTVKVWREQPLTGTGDASESVSLDTEATAATEPGVFWSASTPVWGTAPYATYRIFRAKGYFKDMAGKTLFVAIESGKSGEGSDLAPVRLLQVQFMFNLQLQEWRGSGVLTT
jgi:hypothetical protein